VTERFDLSAPAVRRLRKKTFHERTVLRSGGGAPVLPLLQAPARVTLVG
jgi:hypothetical protein